MMTANSFVTLFDPSPKSKRKRATNKSPSLRNRKTSRDEGGRAEAPSSFKTLRGLIRKQTFQKAPKQRRPLNPLWRIKVSFNSALIFVSGIMTAVLVMQLSMILDDWLASRMPEGIEWSIVT